MSKRSLVFAFAALSAGCGPVVHTEMLGESIRSFSSHGFNPSHRVWVTNTYDSGCDRALGQKEKTGGFGLFSRAPSPLGPHDQLAYEVFANYLTQRKRIRVVETHRHNYQTELNAETHRKVDVVTEPGHTQLASTSPEDLCLLDEAKKRKADRVLVYHILEMQNDKMTIHFRLSDVQNGVIEQAQTLKVENLRAFDFSYGHSGRGGGGGD